MNDAESSELQDRIAQMLQAAEVRLEGRAAARRTAMVTVLDAVARYEAESRRWLEELAMPRLKALAEVFPNSTGPTRSPCEERLAVDFAHTDEYPAHARVEVSVARGRAAESGLLTIEPLIIPILMDYQRGASFALNLENPNLHGAAEFLDSRIVRFVSDYLSIREPGSPYQRDLMVTDPVCRMSFRRADAAASVDHDGRRYYFCMHACRESFGDNPDRYLGADRRTSHLELVGSIEDRPATDAAGVAMRNR